MHAFKNYEEKAIKVNKRRGSKYTNVYFYSATQTAEDICLLLVAAATACSGLG